MFIHSLIYFNRTEYMYKEFLKYSLFACLFVYLALRFLFTMNRARMFNNNVFCCSFYITDPCAIKIHVFGSMPHTSSFELNYALIIHVHTGCTIVLHSAHSKIDVSEGNAQC